MELWRPVQEQVKDTVVQIFAQVAEIDLLQPYTTPQQGSRSGTGFFINAEGELITNAHVINQARAIWIQIPSLGRRLIDAELVGMIPERDLALLRVTQEGLDAIKKTLGHVPFLMLGDSDSVRRSDEVLALGYPLGQQSLKSTTGVISGRESHLIQMSAPINPGSSGGPLLNAQGQVVGVNNSGVVEAQNVGYAIPINDLKLVLNDLHKNLLVRKPFLGIVYNNASDSLIEYLGNPKTGGCYIVEVVKNSSLYKAGVRCGDMLYEINGHKIDQYGDMAVSWSEDKISITEYVNRLEEGHQVKVMVYRKGQRKDFTCKFDLSELPPVRKIYPGYEPIDYEVLAGMVIMPLSLNHIHGMADKVPGVTKFAELQYQGDPKLIITHMFPSSQIYRARTLSVGSTINEVNGHKVGTLAELRGILKKTATDQFLTLKVSDNVLRVSDNILVVLPMEKILKEEASLAADYHFPLSETIKQVMVARGMQSEKTTMPTVPLAV
jgi:serine protease Do